MKIKDVLDSLFTDKKKVEFEISRIKLRTSILETQQIELDVKVPKDLVSTLGSADKWAEFVRGAINHYVAYAMREQKISDSEFEDIFNQIVVESYNGSIPVQ